MLVFKMKCEESCPSLGKGLQCVYWRGLMHEGIRTPKMSQLLHGLPQGAL